LLVFANTLQDICKLPVILQDIFVLQDGNLAHLAGSCKNLVSSCKTGCMSDDDLIDLAYNDAGVLCNGCAALCKRCVKKTERITTKQVLYVIC